MGSTVAKKPIWSMKERVIKGRQYLITDNNMKQNLVNGVTGTEICSGTSQANDTDQNIQYIIPVMHR